MQCHNFQRSRILAIFAAVICLSNQASADNDKYYSHHISQITVANRLFNLPLCRKNLTLAGTVSGDIKQALISSAGQDEQLYIVGQTIDKNENIELVDVYPQGVVIRHNGLLEKLMLAKKKNAGDVEVIENNSAQTGINIAKPPIEMPHQHVYQPNENYKYTSVNTTHNKKYRIMGLPVDSSDLLTQTKFTQAPDGGLTLSETEPGGIYEKLGFQDGDTIRAVDGNKVNSIVELVNLAQSKDREKDTQVLIMRHGNLFNMELSKQHGIEMKMILDPAQAEFGF